MTQQILVTRWQILFYSIHVVFLVRFIAQVQQTFIHRLCHPSNRAWWITPHYLYKLIIYEFYTWWWYMIMLYNLNEIGLIRTRQRTGHGGDRGMVEGLLISWSELYWDVILKSTAGKHVLLYYLISPTCMVYQSGNTESCGRVLSLIGQNRVPFHRSRFLHS